MRIRTAVEGDIDQILACKVVEPIGCVTEDRYRSNLAVGSYRLDWTWVAEEDGRILARAVWWGMPHGEHPRELDCLYADPTVEDRVSVCAALVSRVLETAPPEAELPSYQLLLPTDWRSKLAIEQAVAWRLEAVARAGFTDTVERLRYEWTPEVGLPARSKRLTFVDEPSEDVWLSLFRQVSEGSLDAATRREIEHLGPDRAAQNALATYRMLPGSRDWWRVAYAGEGVVGFGIPSRNDGGHIVAYLGVLPEHRGYGHGNDILSEITHVLAGVGAGRIVGDVDVANAPMVGAFERARYRNFAIRLVASPLIQSRRPLLDGAS